MSGIDNNKSSAITLEVCFRVKFEHVARLRRVFRRIGFKAVDRQAMTSLGCSLFFRNKITTLRLRFLE